MKRHRARAIAKPRRHISTALPPGLVATPAVEWVWTDFLLAYQALELPTGTICAIERGPTTIAAKRNHLVRHLLKNKQLQWYLCLDSDMTPPPNTIPHLLATGRDVVSAVCTTKHPPFNVCAGYYDEKTGKSIELLDFGGSEPVKEVEWTGAACLLVRRNVLEAVGDPWFKGDPSGIGEDTDFCEKVLRAGFKIHVDTSLWVGHLTVTPMDLGHRATHEPMMPVRESLKRACGCSDSCEPHDNGGGVARALNGDRGPPQPRHLSHRKMIHDG